MYDNMRAAGNGMRKGKQPEIGDGATTHFIQHHHRHHHLYLYLSTPYVLRKSCTEYTELTCQNGWQHLQHWAGAGGGGLLGVSFCLISCLDCWFVADFLFCGLSNLAIIHTSFFFFFFLASFFRITALSVHVWRLCSRPKRGKGRKTRDQCRFDMPFVYH